MNADKRETNVLDGKEIMRKYEQNGQIMEEVSRVMYLSITYRRDGEVKTDGVKDKTEYCAGMDMRSAPWTGVHMRTKNVDKCLKNIFHYVGI